MRIGDMHERVRGRRAVAARVDSGPRPSADSAGPGNRDLGDRPAGRERDREADGARMRDDDRWLTRAEDRLPGCRHPRQRGRAGAVSPPGQSIVGLTGRQSCREARQRRLDLVEGRVLRSRRRPPPASRGSRLEDGWRRPHGQDRGRLARVDGWGWSTIRTRAAAGVGAPDGPPSSAAARDAHRRTGADRSGRSSARPVHDVAACRTKTIVVTTVPAIPAESNVAMPSRIADGGDDHAHRQRRAGRLAEAEIQVEDAVEAQVVQHDRVPGLAGAMTGDEARPEARLERDRDERRRRR